MSEDLWGGFVLFILAVLVIWGTFAPQTMPDALKEILTGKTAEDREED